MPPDFDTDNVEAKTPSRKRCAEAKTVHGNETRAKRAERSRKSAEFYQLVALGNSIGLFNGKVALRGRRPASKTPAKETA